MQLTRIQRQRVHTYVCVCILFLIIGLLVWRTERSSLFKIVLIILYLVSGISFQFFLIAIRTYKDLIIRHMSSSVLLMIVCSFVARDGSISIKLFLLINLVYMVWLLGAKGWIRHEIAPGWTLLVYDSSENGELAKKISKSRADLILDACHLQVSQGDDVLKRLRETVNIYHVTQIVLCLTIDSSEINEFCRENGISIFVHINNNERCRNRYKINKDGLCLIMPRMFV